MDKLNNMKIALVVLVCILTGTSAWAEHYRDDEQGETLAQQIPAITNSEGPDWLADVASRIQLHGYAQGWYYYQNAGGNKSNTFLCKRVIFWANAKITDRWAFQFMHDFSSVVQEYYTDYRITNNNMLTVRFGQFKNALSYENPLSPTSMETIDVYSEGVTYLTGCGSDPLNGVQYGRDQGIALFGETDNKKFRYELQVMNGTGINVRDKNNAKDVIARLEFRPAQGLNLCATAQIGKGSALVGNCVFNPKIQQGDDYKRNRWTIGFDYKSTRFNVHGEYLDGIDGDVTSRGAYLTGSVAFVPQKFDLVASYDYFNFNTDENMDMHKIVAGLQYWFFKKCRFQAQYVYKNATTNYSTFFNHDATHQIICQMQVRFN
ncbi:MAG: OprO/OprP family phosphate-selective porin [Bacteroidales bacterium]|nr:OprO/OprP family phosphate-selective porin [Bacteroidales bacterium]